MMLAGCENAELTEEIVHYAAEALLEAGGEADLQLSEDILSELPAGLSEEETEGLKAPEDPTETVIAYFNQLAAIPRPSGHEKEVSDYLYAWAQKAGQNAKQDAANNVIVDIPATAGCENKPLTVLQCHMDMVAVAEEGYSFDPQKDPIKVIRTETELKAEYTSLGGDDGIGVAIAQYIAKNSEKHGPLRLIITTDEEVGQTGVNGLDPALVADAAYLINIDWEEADAVCVTSAGNVTETFTKAAEWVENPWNNPVELRVTGGKGGHSGLKINDGIANANIVMADLLLSLKRAGVRYCLASMEGGTASNAITASSKAVITVHEDDAQRLSEEVGRFNKNLNEKYKETDPDLHVEELYPNLLVQKVLMDAERDNVLTLLTNLVSGVYTMSQKVEKLVEASDNVGIVKIAEDGCKVVTLIRSSEIAPEEHIANAQIALAQSLGFTAEAKRGCYSWPYDSDNPLEKMASEVYRELNGEDIHVEYTHAGLECGTFKNYNQDLKMISVGPDVLNAHSPKETVQIPSIAKSLKLVEGILAKIAE